MLAAEEMLRAFRYLFEINRLRRLFFLICWFAVFDLFADTSDGDDTYLIKKTSQNDIEIYIEKIPNSKFVLFRGTAVFDTTMDSILAVVFDTPSYVDWMYQCKESTLIKSLNFFERYQYQVIHAPFPFDDRDTVVYSKLGDDPITGEVTINFSSSDYCSDKNTPICKKIQSSHYVRIKKLVGSYHLKKVEKGVKMTWTQHAELGGELPGWLVNRYVVATPFQSFLSLAKKLQEERYKQAKLGYDHDGKIASLYLPEVEPGKKPVEPGKKPKDFVVIPTF